jgi:hypothetical protein
MIDLCQLLSVVIALSLGATSALVSAQTTTDAASPTRARVKMDRDDFLKSHRWDAGMGDWVLKPGFEAPVGVKSRAEVHAERDQFLKVNRWNADNETWISVKGAERNLSTMSHDDVRKETQAFVRTHQWDELADKWVPIALKKKQ